jgi:hypothetical protein
MFVVSYSVCNMVRTSRHSTLNEALDECLCQLGKGNSSALCGDDFSAAPTVKNRFAEKPITEWAISFDPIGIYKSCHCRLGERCGIRYTSHRRGYRASLRAFRTFATAIDGEAA